MYSFWYTQSEGSMLKGNEMLRHVRWKANLGSWWLCMILIQPLVRHVCGSTQYRHQRIVFTFFWQLWKFKQILFFHFRNYFLFSPLLPQHSYCNLYHGNRLWWFAYQIRIRIAITTIIISSRDRLVRIVPIYNPPKVFSIPNTNSFGLLLVLN